MTTPAVQNQNPGNLRDPQTGGFQKFSDPADGRAALYNDLTAKMTGTSTTGLNGDSSVLDFAKVYAPKVDHNDPLQYAANIANKMGISPDAKIGTLMPRIDDFASAISSNEDPSATYTPSDSTPALTPNQSADIANSQRYGSTFAANTENPSALGEAGKVVANMIPSAFGLVKNTIDSFNPVNILKNGWDAITGFKGISDEMGFGNALQKTIEQVPSAVTQLLPENLHGLAQATLGKLGLFGNDAHDVTEGLDQAHRSIVNDPVGQILPYIFAAEMAAGGADALNSKLTMSDYVDNIAKNIDEGNPIPQQTTPFGDAFEKGMSMTASPITKPLNYVFGKGGGNVADFIESNAKGAYSKFTGVQPNDMNTIMRNADQFTPENISGYDRSGPASEIASALDKRISSLGDTGEQYNPIRQSVESLPIEDPEFLAKQIAAKTGLNFNSETGKFETSGSANIRAVGDVAKINNFYDLWKPYFEKGSMTNNEFLNMRSDLADMAKYEGGIGKSGPLENAGAGIREALNTEYRPTMKGLEDTDADYNSQISELNVLRKGILDKDGNLLPGATNTIANALGKGKGALIDKLEQISPGISEKIAVGRAMENLQALQGNVVGTYGRTFGTFGAGVLGNAYGGPVGAIAAAFVEHILSSPGVTVNVLKALSKVPPIYNLVISQLKSVNNLPAEVASALNSSKEMTGTPTAFTPKLPGEAEMSQYVGDIANKIKNNAPIPR